MGTFVATEHNKNHLKPLQRWYEDVMTRMNSHSILADKFDSTERALTTISVGLTAVTSSLIFTSISPGAPAPSATSDERDGGTNSRLAIFAGILSALNTVLQAITKNLQLAQAAEQHQIAFKQFTKMRFRIENILGLGHRDDPDLDRDLLNDWIKEYQGLIESSPILPQDLRLEQASLEKKVEAKQNVTMSPFQRILGKLPKTGAKSLIAEGAIVGGTIFGAEKIFETITKSKKEEETTSEQTPLLQSPKEDTPVPEDSSKILPLVSLDKKTPLIGNKEKNEDTSKKI